jgi:tetratricopeptide (TPR) repeat protein
MLTKLGISLEELGKYRESLRYFKQAVKLQTNCATLTNLGISYGNQKKFKEALQCFKKAEKINPKDETILLDIAITSNKLKNYKITLDYAERLIELNETSFSGWIQKALSLSFMKKVDASLNALSIAISLEPEAKRDIATDPAFKNLRKSGRFKKLTS